MENYAVLSLETHLYFARIMKEHSLFLMAGFPCKEDARIKKADWFREQFEELLRDVVRMSDQRVSACVLESGELTTSFTIPAEERTANLSGVAIDTQITCDTKELRARQERNMNMNSSMNRNMRRNTCQSRNQNTCPNERRSDERNVNRNDCQNNCQNQRRSDERNVNRNDCQNNCQNQRRSDERNVNRNNCQNNCQNERRVDERNMNRNDCQNERRSDERNVNRNDCQNNSQNERRSDERNVNRNDCQNNCQNQRRSDERNMNRNNCQNNCRTMNRMVNQNRNQRVNCPIQNNRMLFQQIHNLNERALQLVNGLIEFKECLLQDVRNASVFNANYPLLIEHIIREAKLYRDTIKNLQQNHTCTYQTLMGTEAFWNQIMMEHALFIRGLLDPCECQLIEAADSFASDYKQLLEMARAQDCAASEELTRRTLAKTEEYRTFKAAGTEGILDCKIASIILPLLADHVLREANHYIRILKMENRQMD